MPDDHDTRPSLTEGRRLYEARELAESKYAHPNVRMAAADAWNGWVDTNAPALLELAEADIAWGEWFNPHDFDHNQTAAKSGELLARLKAAREAFRP